MIRLVCSFAIIGYCVGLSSCKDDEPYQKPVMAVNTQGITSAEDVVFVSIAFSLDKPANIDIPITFTLGGSAEIGSDYGIVGSDNVMMIAKGTLVPTLTIEIADDLRYEIDETIEVTFVDPDNDTIDFNTSTIVITIADNDPKPQVSFVPVPVTISESYHTDFFRIGVTLTAAALEDVTLKYEITHGDGYAIDDLYALQENLEGYEDYFIVGGEQLVKIAKGSLHAEILLNIYSDYHFEDDEIIELTITEVSEGIEIGTSNKIEVSLQQEDGKFIGLFWNEEYTDVDMDLFLWRGVDISNFVHIARSIYAGVDPKYEALFIPQVLEDEENEGLWYGAAYTYYSGTQTPMEFEVVFSDYINGEFGPEEEDQRYSGTYTLANLNPWDVAEQYPVPVQTFKLEGGTLSDVSDITIPTSGSRIAKPDVATFHKKTRRLSTPNKIIPGRFRKP